MHNFNYSEYMKTEEVSLIQAADINGFSSGNSAIIQGAVIT